MEGRWGVADVDVDKEEDTDKGADEDEDEDVNSSSQLSQASKFEFEFEVKGGMPWIIQVSGARNDIVNGTYHLLAMSRNDEKSLLPTGPWVRPQGAVVHWAGTPPSSSSPSRGRRSGLH